jgi:hypothetical protein
LDAYSGYNKIKLKREDEEKTAFITPYGGDVQRFPFWTHIQVTTRSS